MYSKATKIEGMALSRSDKRAFALMNKASKAPIELSTAASALLEHARLFLEVPGSDSCFGTYMKLSWNGNPTVCGLRHTLHQPKSSASRLHAMPLTE